MNMQDYSIEELEAEIKRRKTPKIPEPLENIDWSNLINVCDQYLEDIAGENPESDWGQFIYEEVMETVYGEDVFKFINKHL